jgi:tetratricopeptide (TPR) repeat protein
VKSSQRHAAAAASFVALSLVSVPVFAQARNAEPPQRGGPPTEKTPYILVTTFSSADRKLGVEAANEMRHRLQSEHSAKELYVVPKGSIDNTLAASGYPPDSALNSADLMELSKQLHGEYVVDGKATKAGTGGAVKFEVRVLLKTAQSTLAQPLPAADGRDVGDAAKMVERSLSDMLKGIPMFRTCIDNLRAAKNTEAIAAARAGIAAYPNSVLSRICLLNAYANQKSPAAPPDTIISVANQILTYDPSSMLALVNLADAYAAKGDTNKAIETNLKIYRVDPTNAAVAQSIVQQLANSGAPDKALPIIDSLLITNPGDVGMVRTKWLLQLRAKQYKNAIATGDELVKLDTSLATVDFYNRQIGAAQSDSNAKAIQEIASKAGQKFPKDDSFQVILAQSYRKSGQLQQALAAARRATDINPKNNNAWLFAVVTANDLQQPDTAAMLAQKAIAAGADKEQLGQFLLSPVANAVKKAQDSKARDDWEAALKAAQSLDAMVPTATTKFYVGLSAFQVGLDALQGAQKLGAITGKDAKESKVKACAEAKIAEEMWATAQIATPAGASTNKEGAGQIMGAIQQYGEYIPKMKTAYCK